MPYDITPYEVFFGRKYRQRLNSLATIPEQQAVNATSLSVEAIDLFCEQALLDFKMIDTIKTHLEFEVDDETHETEDKDDNEINVEGMIFKFDNPLDIINFYL